MTGWIEDREKTISKFSEILRFRCVDLFEGLKRAQLIEKQMTIVICNFNP